MEKLKSICVKKLTKIIFDTLIWRKLNKVEKVWIMDISQWVQAMKLEELRNYLMNYCISSTFDMLIHEAQERLQDARFHDLLMCCYYLFLNEFTVKIVIPECLKMDQLHRSYLISTLKNYPKVKKIDFQCYSGTQTYYVSEEEQNLLEETMKSFKNLTLVQLSNVLTNNILQALISNCDNLMVLIICNNQSVNDESVCIIIKTHELIRKGPLLKLKALENSQKSTLKLLDISKTSISIFGRTALSNNLLNCKIVTC